MICVQAVTWDVMGKDLNLHAIRGMKCNYKRKNLHITPGLLAVIYAVNKRYKRMGSFIIVKNANMINAIIAVQNKILWLSKHLI
jgi:hypothetical protein